MDDTALRVPDGAIRNLLHCCDGSLSEKKVPTKNRSHRRNRQSERRTNDYEQLVAKATLCLGRKYTMVAQLRYMIDSQHEARSIIKKMSNTMCVHKVVETSRKLAERKRIARLDKRHVQSHRTVEAFTITHCRAL